MQDDPALALEMRRRIVELVRQYAGLHLREIARQLDTSVALIEYHVPRLVKAGAVEVDHDEGFQRLYPAGQGYPAPDKRQRKALAVLRARLPLQVVLVLLAEDGPLRHGELVARLGIGKSTLSFHLRKLERVGLIEKRPEGFAVQQPNAVERLLLAHRPTADLRQEFADLWLTFYDG